jgi:hypothetical protein
MLKIAFISFNIVKIYGCAKKNQCCQGAEISAAKLKKGRKKLAGPGKSGAELFPNLSKKGRKGAKLFLGLVFHKIIYFYCQKLGL